MKGTNDFKLLYRICMTDANFKEGELNAPGYLDASTFYTGRRLARPPLTHPPPIQKRLRSGRPATRLPLSSSTARISYI